MNRYESYKESGVEWLGKIPSRWKAARLKAFSKILNGATPKSDTTEYWGGEIVWITPDDLGRSKNKNVCDSRRKITETGFNNCGVSLAPKGSIVMSTRAPIGHLAILDTEGCTNQGCRSIVVNKGNASFFYYVLTAAKPVLISEGQGTTFLELSKTRLENFTVIFPLPEMQEHIAYYLDIETARIDQLIANKRQQIKKLDELCQITISHAVTRGLDPTTPMKNSGIIWLGEVPEHWQIKRVRDIALLLQTGPFGSQLHSDEYISGGTPVINPSHLIQGKIIPDNKVTIDQQTHERLSRHSIQANDIIFARRGEMGRCALVTKDEEGWLCGTGSLLFRPNVNRSYPPYHAFVLASKGVKEWLELRSVGSTMDNLNTEILGQIPLPMPPPNEQKSIHAFVDVESARFDKLINNINSQIDKLEELRKITINDAVTGKVKVTD